MSRKNFATEWTPREDRVLTQMWKDGFETALIKERLGHDRQRICDRAAFLGLPLRERQTRGMKAARAS